MSLSPVTLPALLLVIFTSAVISNPRDGFPLETQDTTLSKEVQQLKEELQDFKREKRSAEDVLAAQLAQQAQELSTLKAQLQAAENKLQTLNTGSTFVRWGRSVCPSSSQLVYSGVAGGAWIGHTGGSQTRLCLTLHPQLSDVSVPSNFDYMYGAEYWEIHDHHVQDVPCVVCWTQQSATLLMPATRTCPLGWITQYTGYLSGVDSSDDHGAEYVCLDGSPEDRPAGADHEHSSYFEYVVTVCGSLPCPPYTNRKIVTCAVCSK